MRRAFTLTEMLVVIAVIALLMATLLPSLAKARLSAKVLVVNAELYNISVALEAYAMDHKNVYPPARADCSGDTERKHWWPLPVELANEAYLQKGKAKSVKFADIEDKFNRGYTYKYVAVGTCLDYSGTPYKQYLQIPDGFPGSQSDNYVFTGAKREFYSDAKTSPVTWCLFSVGPNYKDGTNIEDGFPVSRKFWYSGKSRSGIITRMRLLKGQQTGTFEVIR